jgi:hypothetical protein
MTLSSSCRNSNTAGFRAGLGDCLPLVVTNMALTHQRGERRREKRHAFPYPIRLRAADREGRLLADCESIIAFGKSLSNSGLEFYFHEAVPHRWMIASLPSGIDQFVDVLINLEWCRFAHEGYYVNFGRIRHVLGHRAARTAC